VRRLITTFSVASLNILTFLLRRTKRERVFNIIIYLFTTIGLLPGGSGYFTCKQNMKLVTTKFKSGGLHEKHVVATWNLGNYLSVCL
jgi:predicted permease